MPLNYQPKESKPEEDKGLLGNALEYLNPIRQAQSQLEGMNNDVAKNVSGALNLFDPTKVVPAFVGQAAKTALETARLPTSLASTAYGAATGNIAPGSYESSPTSFLFNTEYLKNLANPNMNLGEKLGANIQAGSPLVSGVLQGGFETGGRLGLEAKSGASRLPGQEFQSSAQAAQGTRMAGRSYEDLLKQGKGGEAILQDVLTVAPVARGLGTAAGEAGLISEANAARIANAAGAVERAPLAPVSVPLRGGYRALQAAAEGETAFPRLAAATEGTNLAGLSNTLEAGAQNIGKTWANTAARDRFFAERAALMQGEPGAAETPIDLREPVPGEAPRPMAGRGYAEVFKGLEDQANALQKGTPEYDAMQGQIRQLQDALDADAKNAARYGLQNEAKAAAAAKTGKPIEETPIPERFSDEAINKAFEGLDPQKYGDNYWVGLYDKGIKMWRDGVLALNPKWQGGNIVNNSVTAMTFGDVPGEWLTKENLSRVMREIKNPTEGTGAVIGAGQASQFGQVQGTGKVARLKQRMYDANQIVDDVSHAGTYLAKKDALVKSGMSEKAAQAEAAKFANQTMGNFQNMSPFERDIMRRVAPFYAWSKHATKMSLRELALRPEKIARISAKANLALGPNQENREGTDFLKSRTPWGGGQVLQLPGGAEQGTPSGIIGSPLVNPAKMMGALSPVLQIPAVAAGFNPRKGEMLSYAPGQSTLSRIGGYATNATPLGQTIGDIIEGSPLGRGEHVIKGDVREPILSGGRPVASTSQSIGPIDAPVFRFFTGLGLDRPDVEGSVARAVKKRKSDEKSEKNYGKQVNRAAKGSRK